MTAMGRKRPLAAYDRNGWKAVIRLLNRNGANRGPSALGKLHTLRILAIPFLAMFLLGCATFFNSGHYNCGEKGERGWRQLPPPANADLFRGIARDSPVWVGSAGRNERWFGANGKLMLCMISNSPYRGGAGEWWVFDTTTSPPVLQSSEGWVITD